MRLIDIDAAAERFKECYCAGCDSHNGVLCRACSFCDGFDVADSMPTVDLVRRGEWHYLVAIGYQCSECGSLQDYTHYYCPNCGANMMGGASDEID